MFTTTIRQCSNYYNQAVQTIIKRQISTRTFLHRSYRTAIASMVRTSPPFFTSSPLASFSTTSTSSSPSPFASSSPSVSSPLSSGSVRARRPLPSSSSSSSSSSTSVPSLKHFVLRSQVLAMYRRMVRLCRRIPDAQQRQESLEHAATEIRTMKNATETSHIKALLQEGKRKIDMFETMLNLTK